MSADGFGEIRGGGGLRAVVFERRFDATPAEVWSALTDRDRLRRWFTDVTVDPHVGGAVLVDWGEAGSNHGKVLRWEPERCLEYTMVWAGVHDSVLRFELRACGAGTVLRLEHHAVAARVAGDLGSGWHAYLDALADLVEGRPVGDWTAREAAVSEHYASAAAAGDA